MRTQTRRKSAKTRRLVHIDNAEPIRDDKGRRTTNTPVLEESMLETTLQSLTEVSPYTDGERKLIRNRLEQKSTGRISLHLEEMNETEDTQQDIHQPQKMIRMA